MLIPLICKQCGGKLEVDEAKVLISGDSFIVLPNQSFECQHCGTKYLSDDANKSVHVSGGGIAIGAISIGGELKGNIVIGTGISPIGTNATSGSKTKNQTKKWWEFWK